MIMLASGCNTAGGGSQVREGDVPPMAVSDLPEHDTEVASQSDTDLPEAPAEAPEATPVPPLGLNLSEATVGAKIVLKIVSVRPDTAAANADLQIGDLLIALNGRPVNTLQDYARELLRIGQSGVRTILVRVFDQDQEFDIPVVLNP